MAIQIKNLRKSFGEKEILKGIDFSFEQGKINMIIGASGSGKSVMLKCIVGLMNPSSGEVLYDGMNFHEANHKDVRSFRKNMGMLFQYSALFDSMTVEQNIAFPLKLFTKYTAKAINNRVRFCLERVNMAGTGSLFPAELSGGMMKRVGIARAIALNPKYLFVDEPNSGLDPLTASVVDELIKEITYEYNMCTVVVSHDMNSVVNISDKIMFLHHGVKAWEGDKRSILRSGNEDLDKFVFVSDLIRRDLYDDELPNSNASGVRQPRQVDRKEVEARLQAEEVEQDQEALEAFSVKQSEGEKAEEKQPEAQEATNEAVSIEVAVEESKEEEPPTVEEVKEQVKQAAIEEAVGKIEGEPNEESDASKEENKESVAVTPVVVAKTEEAKSSEEPKVQVELVGEGDGKKEPVEVEKAVEEVKEVVEEVVSEVISPPVKEETIPGPEKEKKEVVKGEKTGKVEVEGKKKTKKKASKETAVKKAAKSGKARKKGELHPADARRLKRQKKKKK